MKKQLFTVLLATALFSCSKSEQSQTVAIDMTAKSYSADAKYGSLPVILQLNFESNGTAKLKAYPSDDVVVLKYEVANAENTTLRIHGELDKSLSADEFTKGKLIDWNTAISRLPYKPEIVGFKVGDYHFTSY